jgi:N-acetylmuramic acid 6-phosphate etherase
MLRTEQRNEHSTHIDKMTSLEMVSLMNQENMNSVKAVEAALPQIAEAVDAAAKAIGNGGKLVYIGAGTSGRLGVLDASECPPTFGVNHETVQGIIAGGPERMFKAGENAEDVYENGVADVEKVLKAGDVLVGISAAGGAKYVIGALEKAKEMGCTTVSVSSNPDTAIEKVADIAIVCDTGPEVVTGSTRLKSGTSQKLILNMISTATMVGCGKAYQNLMVDVMQTNEKLIVRAQNIVMEATGCDRETAEAAMAEAGNHAKTAITMILADCSAEEARERLKNAGGHVRQAIR